jgi:hypothetical protein
MTAPKIAKADYMLLFIRINSINDQVNERTNEMERVFNFEHVAHRFAPNDHIWSRDKDAITHCYRDLKQGEYYMIFAHRVADLDDVKRNGRVFHRWVWRAALQLTEEQIRKVNKFHSKHESEPKLVAEFADFIKHPRILPAIQEFSYE